MWLSLGFAMLWVVAQLPRRSEGRHVRPASDRLDEDDADEADANRA